MQRPCNARPEPASLRVPPALRIRFVDFQPDPVIAVTVLFSLRNVIAVKRNNTGDASGRGRGEKTAHMPASPAHKKTGASAPVFIFAHSRVGLFAVLILIDREAGNQLTVVVLQLRLQLSAWAEATTAAGVERATRRWV
ncbi:hypothetical protein ACUY4Q_000216 [Phytobacter sp. AG2a]